MAIGIIIFFIYIMFKYLDMKFKIKRINDAYKSLFKERDRVIKFFQIILVFLSEFMCFLAIYISIIRCINKEWELSFLIEFLLLFACFFIVHYLMGYILLISEFIKFGVNKNIRADFLLSYFLTSIYSLIIILFPFKIKYYALSGIMAVIICYLCNLKILFRIMKNPSCVKFKDNERNSFTKLCVAVMIILIMIIVNLYLGVCLVNSLESNAFSNNPTLFDLLYYTIVTFTTIGFGDIIPLSIPAKFMAVIISITSIICITIFLGSIFSIRNKK